MAISHYSSPWRRFETRCPGTAVSKRRRLCQPLTPSLSLRMFACFASSQHEMAWNESTVIGTTGTYCDPDVVAGCDPRDQSSFWPPAPPGFSTEAVRVIGSIFTFLAIAASIGYYQTLLKSKQSKNLLPASATVLGSNLGLPFVLEIIGLLVHPFPFILSLGMSDPGLYLAFLLIPLLRCALLLRIVRYHSPLNSSNGRFIGALTNVEFDGSFILKTVLKERPVSVLIAALLATVLASAYAIHVIESIECSFYRSLGCPPLTMGDSLWLIIITGLTVGYGDVVAHTL